MALPLEIFERRLVDSGILSREEITRLGRSLRAEAGAADGATWAARLVEQKRLTAFQAETLTGEGPRSLRLGNYVLLDRIGAGGMGEVYRALHLRMQRHVALKMLPPAATSTPSLVERFEQEVRAAARLEHPNVVRAYDADAAGDRHFLVMEYVDGRDLATVVREEGPLPVARATDFVRQAAEGLAYAHREGVIHRDVKPSNLLLDAEGRVKLLDLGLARLDAGAGLTQTGEFLGTADTMAPEQVDGTTPADERSDVYGLGCTLFTLLTGRPVYERPTLMGVLLAHRTETPPSLRALRPQVPEALDVLFRAMVAKRPEDRPATMATVLDALDGLDRALPPVRTRKGAPPRGPRRALLAALLVALAIAAGLQLVGRGSPDTAPSAPGPVRGASFAVTFTTPTGPVNGLDFAPRGRRLAVASGDGSVLVLDAESGTVEQRLEGHEDAVRAVRFTPDGSTLVSCANDRTVRVWNLDRGVERQLLVGHDRRVRDVALLRDGAWLASTGRDGTLRIWDLAGGEELARAQGHGPSDETENTGILSVCAHPDGRRLATAGYDRSVCIWRVAPLEVVHRIGPHPTDVGYTAFSPDGRLLAYDTDLGKVRIVGSDDGEERLVLPGHNGWVLCLAFEPGGEVLATGGEDGVAKLWRVADGALLATLEGHREPVSAVAFSADGRRLATGSTDETIKLWDLER